MYSPTFDNRLVLELLVVSCGDSINFVKMEEMNAAVEPLPFVPAMCIGLSLSKSDAYPAS